MINAIIIFSQKNLNNILLLLLANIDEKKYNFNDGFKLELVTTFYIRFCYDSCKSIAKNIVNVTLSVEKYNWWEWTVEEKIKIKKE